MKLQWPLQVDFLRGRLDPRLMQLSVCIGVSCWGFVISDSLAFAQSRRSPLGNTTPTALQQLLERRPKGPIVTENTPSQQGFTVPSLWWTNQQFGEKLVLDWQAYGIDQVGTQQISVIVRPELWTRYSYYERYAFVLKFGTDASHFGYQLFVQDAQDLLLGAYTCKFTEGDPSYRSGSLNAQSRIIPGDVNRKPLPCSLWLNPNYPRTVF
ncbi:hypothetical protein [Acaryochloris sp. IP29b_bin.137]|uniref:hypothetical protein n=1 Tax=Acaryochloris sp. IP29b_bin.137 TaxID=2969217 RepID=UPI002616B604|nr:hypothetical protein [Acaryochloris sp. IP29b_bin.137]